MPKCGKVLLSICVPNTLENSVGTNVRLAGKTEFLFGIQEVVVDVLPYFWG